MARRPIMVDPRGGLVRVRGRILDPAGAPLKIDLWRRVRFPPPELIHGRSIKAASDGPEGLYEAGQPSALVGKVLTWVWLCEGRNPRSRQWHVLVDVEQDGASVPGFPAEYSGPIPPGKPLSQLRVAEQVQEAR